MALAQVVAGARILISDLNAYYSLLKGSAGESITLVFNAAGSLIFQPSSDPSGTTQLVQLKNNAGTVKSALTAAGGALFSSQILEAQGSDIASAGTTDLSAATGNYVNITGTTTITAFGTVQAGTVMRLKFAGILTLTHNASSLILRGAANATTAAGDVYIFVSEGSGNWREISHLTAGSAVAGGTLVSRYLNAATVSVNNSATGYTDFGGSFTTSPTTATGDKVHIMVQGNFNKATSGYAAIVVDRGGTKLPAAGTTASVRTEVLTSYIPYSFDYWDTPGAGTFTYKAQVYSSDTGVATAGGGTQCQFTVEVWR